MICSLGELQEDEASANIHVASNLVISIHEMLSVIIRSFHFHLLCFTISDAEGNKSREPEPHITIILSSLDLRVVLLCCRIDGQLVHGTMLFRRFVILSETCPSLRSPVESTVSSMRRRDHRSSVVHSQYPQSVWTGMSRLIFLITLDPKKAAISTPNPHKGSGYHC